MFTGNRIREYSFTALIRCSFAGIRGVRDLLSNFFYSKTTVRSTVSAFRLTRTTVVSPLRKRPSAFM